METVAIEDVPVQVNSLQVHDVRKPVSDALGTEHVAMNYFELAPGDSFSGGLHRHNDQEGLFSVASGTAEFEVGRERETVAVGAGDLVRFEDVVGWALGAPGDRHDWSDLDSLVYCRECDTGRPHGTTRTQDGRFRLTCTACENAFEL